MRGTGGGVPGLREPMLLPSDSGGEWPLIGRVSELEQIKRSRRDGGSGMIVVGPAGVGKSRLASEALAEAQRDGATTSWVQATRSAASVPLGAFAEMIPNDVRSDDPLELIRISLRALRAAGPGKLVLGVDDAQLLDPPSAALVLQLTITATAFVVATLRTGEPCPDAITSLWKDARVQRLELETLTEEQTETLAETMVGGPIEQGARRWIWDTSRGNALYVRELVLGALTGGALKEVHGLWRLPVRPPVSASLAELITARMTGLAGAEQETLELLALGEPLRLSEMIGLIGGEPLTSMEARGLITIQSASKNGGVTLAHPLYGEAIRASLPTLRARQARLKLAATLQRRRDPEPQDSLRIARWLLDADESIATSLLLQAARAANLAGNPDLGAQLATRAMEAGAGIQAALLLARAHTIQNRHQEAEAVLAAAEPEIDTQQIAVDYLEQRTDILYWGLKRPEQLRELMERAQAWWPDPGWQRRLDPLRLRLASAQGPGATVSVSAEILASGDLDPEVRRQIEPVHVASLFYSGQTREAFSLARRIRPVLPLRDLSDELAFVLWSTIAIETGEGWQELESWATAALQDSIRLGDRAAAGRAALGLGGLRFSEGRFVEASRWLAEAELQLEHHDSVGLLAITNSMQVGVACFTGDTAAVGPALERCRAALGGKDPLPNQLPYFVRAEAWAANAEGDPPRAQRLLLDAAEKLSVMPIYAARLTYEAMRAGAPARRLTGQLEGLRQRCDARLVAAYAAHAAAHAAGDGQALLQTVDEMEAIGALRYATEAAAHAAGAFARAGRHDSARRAAVRSQELHARGQGGLAPSIDGVDTAAISLTPRETQLVELATRGLSNSEIADRLVLSVRTVESHLYRAMQKLGISDRHDL